MGILFSFWVHGLIKICVVCLYYEELVMYYYVSGIWGLSMKFYEVM
jgi:hypothetical protein